MTGVLNKKISTTGIRVLLILDILTAGPASKEEIIDILSKNSFQNATKEMVKIDINTLKEAGFEIINLGKTENYRYKIIKSPIKIELKKDETDVLARIRNAVFKIEDWKEILKLYELFEKISKFVEPDIQEELMNFQYFSDVDFKILKELNTLSLKKRTVLLSYNSPNSGIKEIPIKLENLKYENSKIYITGKSPNYPDTTVLRADKIKEIKKLLQPIETEEKTSKRTIYILNKENLNNFLPLENEKIINETENEIKVEIEEENNFFTIQRLLSFGKNLKEIENEKIKKLYKEELNKILEIYKGK